MTLTPHSLVTIIAERSVRDRLLDAIHALGATGHTLYDVRGEGSRGAHVALGDQPTVKIETIVAPDVAERIVAHVAARYFTHHAVVVYVQEVGVVRGSKYAPGNTPAE